jgi:ABC-type branched-subunit amino acid transport system substrate-binding protein
MGTGRGRRTGRGRIALAIVAAASMLTACAGGDAPPPTVGGEDPEQGEEQEQEEESEFAEDDAGEEPVSEDEILIGIVDGLSGSVSGFVEDKIRGAELAVEQANEDGGVLGRQIRTALRDDELEPGTAVQQVQALYQQAGAHVVMGSISSAVLLAVNEWIANNDRHYLAWDARTSAATEEEGNDGLVRTLSNTSMDAVAMATFFADQDYERWAMIAPNYEYGQALTSARTASSSSPPSYRRSARSTSTPSSPRSSPSNPTRSTWGCSAVTPSRSSGRPTRSGCSRR